MSFERVLAEFKGLRFVLVTMCALLLLVASAPAQEITGGMEGTVTDPSGAIVPGAHLVLTSPALVGAKEIDTDAKGSYRFANLPAGTYTIKVSAKGFEALVRGNLTVQVGGLPTVDLQLQIGASTTTVEVTSSAPLVDVTSNQNVTDLDSSTLNNIPHGLSYQSVIQFAPMARNEPLAGFTAMGQGSGGTGGSTPGSTGNGLAFGYMIGGASDSENAYLINGQDTEHISGGYSKANLPFQFIDSVNMETSGIQAEYGGALGGVVNAVTRSGSNDFHGSFFATYGGSGVDANNNNAFLRYNPFSSGAAIDGIDASSQVYDPKEDHFKNVQPGFTIGGPIAKNRLWFFAGFAPQFNSLAKTVNFDSPTNFFGNQYFTQDQQTYFTNVRLDAAVTQKIRLYAAWVDQFQRETGESMPVSDPVASQAGYLNPSINTPISDFNHGLGFSAPNSLYNLGADITITPRIVATSRFGYFFENYHDFGWPTVTPNLQWITDAFGADDNAGKALPPNLALVGGTTTAAYDSTFTQYNANKHYQFNQDVAFFKSWMGSHNLKVGYQLNYLHNVVNQNGNVPLAFVYAGAGDSYSPSTTTGAANCGAAATAKTPASGLIGEWGVCGGQYGYMTIQDFATVLPEGATDWNHALYAQDSWTIGHGLTLNLGIRVEKEDLPAPGGVNVPSIHFGWTDKVAPRLGVAWDPTGHGKMKLFASYGVVNDVMKLLLAQTSFGAQAYEDCTYALGPDGTPAGFSVSDINLVFKNNRACPTGGPTVGANFSGTGATPPSFVDAATGISLIENVDFRPAEPVAPGVKPFRQHEYTAGWDYAISPTLAFEVRYDRRRLDHVIEDASLADPTVGELYTVVNPGQGVDKTIDGYAAFLQSLGNDFLVPGGYSFNSNNNFGTCPTCPPNPTAIRNYDGVEFRLTKNMSRNFSGMFSYTWSSLWGNYTGLTTTDQVDGNAPGRDSPDTTRAFDEPFYYFKYNGKSNDGPLPTDRPNTFKGYGYYTIPWDHMKTTFGLFQYLYQGTPMSSYTDLAAMFAQIPYEATYIFGRGQYAPVTTDANGNITFGTPYARRTPWFTQTDFNVSHEFQVGEGKTLKLEASAFNLWNQHAVLQYYTGFNSANFETALKPNGIGLFSGALLYQTLETGYNPQTWVGGGNCVSMGNAKGCSGPAVIKSSWYGQPQQYQLGRNMLLSVTYQF